MPELLDPDLAGRSERGRPLDVGGGGCPTGLLDTDRQGVGPAIGPLSHCFANPVPRMSASGTTRVGVVKDPASVQSW